MINFYSKWRNFEILLIIKVIVIYLLIKCLKNDNFNLLKFIIYFLINIRKKINIFM